MVQTLVVQTLVVFQCPLSRATFQIDKFVDGHFIHATGFEDLVDGEWEIEYEGEEFEDADGCILEYEEEEEEE